MPERRLDHLEVAWPLLKGARPERVATKGKFQKGGRAMHPLSDRKELKRGFAETPKFVPPGHSPQSDA